MQEQDLGLTYLGGGQVVGAVAGTLLEIENLGEQTLLYFFADALAGLGVPGEVWWTIFDLFTLAGAFLRVPDLIFGTLQGLQAHTLAEVVVPNEVGRTLEYLGAQALAEGCNSTILVVCKSGCLHTHTCNSRGSNLGPWDTPRLSRTRTCRSFR